MKLITGNSNRTLAAAIAKDLNIPLAASSCRRFADDEIFVEFLENVRGEDVFLLQSTSFPANDNLMELLVMIDTARRASASRVTCVIPYFGYARQDRKTASRTPITAKLVANMLTAAGADRVLSLELHAGQIQGFFDIPVDHLLISPVMVPAMQQKEGTGDQVVVVSPDVGGVGRARAFAKQLNVDLAIIDKRREKAGVSEVMNVIGDIKDRNCIIVDDIVDSGGTLCNAAQALIDQGAKSVSAYIVHGVLTGGAVAKIANSALTRLVITDSIEQPDPVRRCPKIEILSVDNLMAEAITRIHEERSISDLFV